MLDVQFRFRLQTEDQGICRVQNIPALLSVGDNVVLNPDVEEWQGWPDSKDETTPNYFKARVVGVELELGYIDSLTKLPFVQENESSSATDTYYVIYLEWADVPTELRNRLNEFSFY